MPNRDCVGVSSEELDALEVVEERNAKGLDWTPAPGGEKKEVDVVEGVEETPKIDEEVGPPCAGDFPKKEDEGHAGIENKLDDDAEGDELDDDSGLDAVGILSFSFCIFWRVDLYDSRIPDMSAKGSSSKLLEMAVRREWFSPRILI